jgi:hypothetical protein
MFGGLSAFPGPVGEYKQELQMELFLFSFPGAGAMPAPSFSSGAYAQHRMQVRCCLKHLPGPPE